MCNVQILHFHVQDLHFGTDLLLKSGAITADSLEHVLPQGVDFTFNVRIDVLHYSCKVYGMWL